jgi:hypothetical protein
MEVAQALATLTDSLKPSSDWLASPEKRNQKKVNAVKPSKPTIHFSFERLVILAACRFVETLCRKCPSGKLRSETIALRISNEGGIACPGVFAISHRLAVPIADRIQSDVRTTLQFQRKKVLARLPGRVHARVENSPIECGCGVLARRKGSICKTSGNPLLLWF